MFDWKRAWFGHLLCETDGRGSSQELAPGYLLLHRELLELNLLGWCSLSGENQPAGKDSIPWIPRTELTLGEEVSGRDGVVCTNSLLCSSFLWPLAHSELDFVLEQKSKLLELFLGSWLVPMSALKVCLPSHLFGKKEKLLEYWFLWDGEICWVMLVLFPSNFVFSLQKEPSQPAECKQQ